VNQQAGVSAVRNTSPPPPLDRILGTLIADLRSALDAELVGAYLYGSAVSGGFDAELSDLDLVVATERSVDATPHAVFAGIIERLQQREPDWADRLDIVFIGRRTLADFRSGGPFVEISHPLPLWRLAKADDWLETWFLVREADRALIGPPPSTLIPPIEAREFLATIVGRLDDFVAAPPDDSPDGLLAYRLLTLCRLLRSLESGVLCTKVEGAAWAIAQLPERAPLVRAALEVRSSHERRRFTPAERAGVPALLELLAERARARAPRA
jgi:Aminoglycoside adenylyltransferase, C-terminal domain